jgi:hypothetical protein
MKVAARNPIAWREKSANCGALLRSTRLSRDEAGPAAAKKNKNTLRRRYQILAHGVEKRKNGGALRTLAQKKSHTAAPFGRKQKRRPKRR